MADFNNLALTVSGVKALLEAQAGTTLTLNKIGMGSGSVTNSTSLTGLAAPELILPISEKKVDSNSGYMTIIARMTNEDITEGFYWRETGLFFEDSEGNDVLFAYACVSDNQYDYVPAYSDQRYVKHIRIANIITDSANIDVKVNEGLLYVDTLTFNEFKVSMAEFEEEARKHISSTGNVHGLKAEDIGAATEKYVDDQILKVIEETKSTVEASGEAIVVNDSATAPFLGMKVYGKTTQASTTGAQLFDVNNVNQSSEVVIDENGWITATRDNSSGTGITYLPVDAPPSNMLEVSTEYVAVLEVKSITSGCTLGAISSDTSNLKGQFNNNFGVTSTGTHVKTVLTRDDFSDCVTMLRGLLIIPAGVNASVTYRLSILTDTSVAIGSFVYEPYTGGIVSPNPEYPQELVSVGDGDGGSVEIDVYGKNLLENTAVTGVVNNMTFTVNDDGSVTANGTANSNNPLFVINSLCALKAGTYAITGCPSGGGSTKYSIQVVDESATFLIAEDIGSGATFTLDEAQNVYVRIRIVGNTTVSNLTFYPMICYASVVDNTYEPYTKQSYPITIQNGLPGIPVTDESLANYTDADGQMWLCDEVDFERGVYVKRIYQKVFTGEEGFTKTTTTSGGNYFSYDHSGIAYNTGTDNLTGSLCNMLSEIMPTELWMTTVQGFAINNSGSVLRLQFTDITTVDDLKAKLAEWYEAGNPLTIYAVALNVTEITLTDEEIAAYKALCTNAPVTTVLNSANAHMEIEYFKSNDVGKLAAKLEEHFRDTNNPHEVTPEQIGAARTEYVDQQIALVTSTGIPKLMVYPLPVTAESDNQTVFDINLTTFDADTDTVLVQSGRTMLFPNQDFTVVDSTVVLNEGVPSGRTIGIYVFKNVPLGEEGSVSGAVLAAGSVPLDRLAEMPTASDVGAAAASHKHAAGDIESGTLPIGRGGTGASTRIGAITGLAFIGDNPIKATADDTIANWIALGFGYAFYSVLGQLTDQPTQYGLVINIPKGDSEIFQIWKTQATGPMYIRSGNASGWAQTWAKVYDSLNKPTPSDIGAAASSHTHPASQVTAGTLPSGVVATNGTDYTTYRLRNIAYNTGALTAGSSGLTNGTIYFQYE